MVLDRGTQLFKKMIKTIIFDFGGVISIGKFFPVVSSSLGEKFGLDEKSIREKLYAHETEYMSGRDSTFIFWEKTCKEFGIPYQDFVDVFNSSYQLNTEMLALVKRLKDRYQVILHSDNFEALSKVLRNDPQLNGLFEKMYFSNEIQLLKKEEQAFWHILKDIRKTPAECVFVDDKEASFIIPKKIGMNTILFKDVEQFKKDLLHLGVQ